MNKFNKLKQKYDSLIKEALAHNRDILIESFVEYYGEEYRELIEKRFDEIIFAYYIDCPSLDFIIKNLTSQTDVSDKYNDFLEFRKAYLKAEKSKKGILSKIAGRLSKEPSNLSENMVGITNEKILEEDYVINKLKSSFEQINPRCFNYGPANNLKKIISFPILILSDLTIIHEINHAITSENVLAIMTDENKNLVALTKVGLEVSLSNQESEEKILEELINERVSLDIGKIFQRRGGSFSSFCFNIPVKEYYKDNLYLIDDFYTFFKEILKKARITENKNFLMKKIGKENYQHFLQLINKNYLETTEVFPKLEESVQNEIRTLINAMKEHEKSSYEYKKETLEKYYQTLSEEGYTVIPMEVITKGRKR